MNREITFSVSDYDLIKIVKVSGNISNTGKMDLEVFISELTHKNNVILDMKKVNVITSGGMSALINVSNEARKRRKRVLITGLRDHFIKMLEMMGLLQYIIVANSVEDGILKIQQ